jgi:hypothetical protein
MRHVRTLYIPGDTVVVDETMIPFRGRLLFKQYHPSKASKYEIKLYKVCTPQGFTWDDSIQAGSGENLNGLDLSSSKIVRLTEQPLDEGRLVITDNYYTSIGVAEFLLSRKTNLLGTIRKHRKGLPEDVVCAKWAKGEVISRQKNRLSVLKWKDQRDVLMLSTCFGANMENVGKDRRGNDKPCRKLSWNIIEVSKERIFLINYQVITRDRNICKMHICAYYAYLSNFCIFSCEVQ